MTKTTLNRAVVKADFAASDGAVAEALEAAIEANIDDFCVRCDTPMYGAPSEDNFLTLSDFRAEGELLVDIDISGSPRAPEAEAEALKTDFEDYPFYDMDVRAYVIVASVEAEGNVLKVRVVASDEVDWA